MGNIPKDPTLQILRNIRKFIWNVGGDLFNTILLCLFTAGAIQDCVDSTAVNKLGVFTAAIFCCVMLLFYIVPRSIRYYNIIQQKNELNHSPSLQDIADCIKEKYPNINVTIQLDR